jgi:hypothetical protein
MWYSSCFHPKYPKIVENCKKRWTILYSPGKFRKIYCTVRLTVLQWVLGYCTVRPLEALGASDGWLYPSDGWGTDKDHWLILFIRKLTWPTVANILATLPPISPFLDYLSCPLVYVSYLRSVSCSSRPRRPFEFCKEMSLPTVKKKKRVAHCFICGSIEDDENHRFGTFEVKTIPLFLDDKQKNHFYAFMNSDFEKVKQRFVAYLVERWIGNSEVYSSILRGSIV